MRAVCFICH